MKSENTSEAIRIQKILADAGVASRRECEEIVRDGDVTINGKVAQLGDKAVVGKDHIKLRGRLLQLKVARKVVVVFFKPRGLLTHAPGDVDTEIETVLHHIPRIREKVMPIGRLDKDAEGVVLLTNDGELAARLNKKEFEVEKVYSVKIDGQLDEKRLRRLASGIEVEGHRTKPAEVSLSRASEGKSWILIRTTEVRNRAIRGMFEGVGRPVDKVRREAFAGVTLKGLVRGQYRYLTPDEVLRLQSLVGLAAKEAKAKPKKSSTED
jgi:23S rRNA pseudouridine2605 synthase